MAFDEESLAPATLAVRAGQVRGWEQEHSEPIYTTSSFVFNSAAEAAARFAGDEGGNIYSRFTNPTVRTFETRLAALEGAERCVATSSGMAAILSTCLAFLEQGDHIVCSQSVFGTTTVMLTKYLQKFGVTTSFVPLTELDAWQAALTPQTKLLFAETPSNPMGEVANIAQLAELAHAHGALLAIDNCFCTPVLQRPLDLGADLVIHSATKYLDGQGRCVGGAVLGSNELLEQVFGVLRSCGPTMSPFNAWVFLKGLETLPLRMRAHSDNALQLAQWLQQQDGITRVFYPGLADHPQHSLAQQQQSGFGGVLAFEIEGGQHSAWQLIDNTMLLSITANLGDSKTTITHPASTTHSRLSEQERTAAGISPGLVRVAVGLEQVEDIQADLSQAIEMALYG